MVGAIHLRLDEEEVFRIADMPLQVLRHRRQRLEQAWKDAVVGRGDRVRAVDDVKVDRAVVGVDDDLDRVADVVEIRAGGRRGIGRMGK